MDSTAGSSGLFASLVIVGDRNGVLAVAYSPSINNEDLLQEILAKFSDVDELSGAEPSTLLLQIKSEEWGGEYVDVTEHSVISNRSVLRLIKLVQEGQSEHSKVCI